MREGGVAFALRAAEGADGVRGGITPAVIDAPAAVRPLATRISLPIVEDAAEEFVFTKRCSRGSKAMEESLPRETERAPDLASSNVLETRVGRVVAARFELNDSRGGDFKVSHFCPRSKALSCALAPFVPTPEKTPCSKFSGVFPLASSGCMGTIPVLPPWRTKTAVTG